MNSILVIITISKLAENDEVYLGIGFIQCQNGMTVLHISQIT